MKEYRAKDGEEQQKGFCVYEKVEFIGSGGRREIGSKQ